MPLPVCFASSTVQFIITTNRGGWLCQTSEEGCSEPGSVIPLVRSSRPQARRLAVTAIQRLFRSAEISFFNHQPLESHHNNFPSCVHWTGGGQSVHSAIQVCATAPSLLPATFLSLVVAANALRICHCGSRVHPPLGGYASKSLARPSSTLDQFLMHAIEYTLQHCGSPFRGVFVVVLRCFATGNSC